MPCLYNMHSNISQIILLFCLCVYLFFRLTDGDSEKVPIFTLFFSSCALQGLRLNFTFAKFSVKCRLKHMQSTNTCCSVLNSINLNYEFIPEMGEEGSLYRKIMKTYWRMKDFKNKYYFTIIFIKLFKILITFYKD